MKLPATKLSWAKIAFWCVSVLFALVFAWCAQPGFRDNSNAVTVLTTVFSVLAGFLIAVIAVAADDRVLRGRSWRHDVGYALQAAKELRFHRSMFELYLTVLALGFVGAIKLPIPADGQVAIERGTIFLAAMAALLSFTMPLNLTRRYMARLMDAARNSRSDLLEKDARDTEG